MGLDLLLASFALGAAQVAVLAAGSHDPAPLAAQVRIGEAILAGLGYGEGHFRILTDDDPEALAANLRGWPSAAAVPVAADFRLLDTKRDTLELAIAHLRRHAPLAVHEIALPAGAPFGSVTASECLHPVHGLRGQLSERRPGGGSNAPRLSFIEHHCLQCGLCVTAAPSTPCPCRRDCCWGRAA